MSVWEYKVISSGKGGFASPALLEKFLGDLGRDEWEIIHYQTLPDNPLAFSGLARRPTQRDWTLQDAAAAAAKAEAEKLRAEFEAKFKGATAGGGAPGEEPPASFLDEKAAPDDGFRKPVDTSHDADADDEEPKDEWDKLTESEEEELPTFFEAIRPHMRRNQRGPGMAVGVEYLAKKWDQSEDDLKGALAECGFVLPDDEDAKPEYLEYDGDLFWLNVNRRGELWINTKEKPRPVFRPVKGTKAVVEEAAKTEAGGQRSEDGGREKPDGGNRKPDRTEGGEAGDRGQETASGEAEARTPKPEVATGGPLPEGPALIERIRPMMRRNRRGPGGSGSASFLARAMKVSEADLRTAFVGLGLTMPADASDKPVYTEIDNQMWWLNLDSRGGLWINGRDKRGDEKAGGGGEQETGDRGQETPTPAESATSPQSDSGTVAGEPVAGGHILSATRTQLKPGKGGTMAAKLEGIAEATGHAIDALVSSLVAAGLKLPEKPREKPVYTEHAGEQFWLSRTAKGELWLNARSAKADEAAGEGAEGSGEAGEGEAKKSRRPRSRKKDETASEPEKTE